jgi:type I restriction enzyme S subunit
MKAGWELKEIAAVSAINYGYTESASSEPVGPRFLRITDIQDDRVDWESVPYCKIPTADLSKYRLASGDIVFARTGATTGKSFLVSEPPDAVFASYLIRLRLLDKKLLPEFVSLFFQTDGYWKSIKDGSIGSAQGGFNATKLGALSIPIPPLREQQRIVGILDEAFEGIATAKANAEKNLQNARALFESHLQSVFSQRGPGWVEKPLETVSTILNGYAFKSTDFSPKQGVKCIKITNVGVREFVCQSDGYLPDSFAAEYDSVSVKKGSIVLALTRTIIAGGLKVAVVPYEYDGALLNQRVASIITNDEHLTEAFLFAYLSTQTVVDYVKERVNTLMQPNLSITDLRSLPIPAPPRREQQKITEQLDGLREETQRLESIYKQKLAVLEALKKTLLHQAFTGKL